MTWKGTNREFADWIVRAHDEGKLKATSRTDAMRQAADHFVGKDGKRIDPRSTLQSLKNRDDYHNPKKVGPR
jgi:hypothetical protein